MIQNKTILIKNIYYMLSYVYESLRQPVYQELEGERFEDAADLFAAILGKGIAQQLKHGLYREYVSMHESIPTVRGKLDLGESLKHKMARRQVMACEYDEFSENNIMNQILKTTSYVLLRQNNIKRENHNLLKRVLLYFSQVDFLDPKQIQWDNLHFNRQSKSYILLINICHFILKDLLLTTETGSYKLASFFEDEDLHNLFENFVKAYYSYHYRELHPRAPHISWAIDDEFRAFLPTMRTDLCLSKGTDVLIIDTKYYGQIMQKRSDYNSVSVRSNHLYQIFTYVKNMAGNYPNRKISGLLLYAKTNEDITPNTDYQMSGNRISTRTLDLNRDFSEMKKQLDDIAMSWLKVSS